MPTIKLPSKTPPAADSSSHSKSHRSKRQCQRQSSPSMLSQREQEMNKTLQEALNCTSCPIHLSKADMDRDMQSGTYDPSRDPPFVSRPRPRPRSRPRFRSSFSDANDYYKLDHDHDHDHAIDSDYASITPEDHDHDHDHDGEGDMDIDMDEEIDQEEDSKHDDVSPLDSMPKPTPRARYASLTTPSQRQQYQVCVLEALSELIGPLGHLDDDWDGSCSPRSSPPPPPPAPQTLSDVQGMVDEDDIRFACYRVDYHIYLHDCARSSMLSMCRDIDDVWQLRGWQTEVCQLDREILRLESQDNKEEDGLLEVHLMAGWRRAWRAREKRVHEVKKTWAGIVAERKRQRAKMLRERRDHGGKIRFYTRQEGNRVLLREFSL